MKRIICVLTVIVLSLGLFGCANEKNEKNIWENAVYKEDTELGNGKISINVKVEGQEKTINFKINTDKTTLGDALVEYKLISGEQGAYGLYVKEVNGMIADYDKDKSYWAITCNGESVMTGVDGVKINSGDNFEFLYTKN